MSRVRTKTTYAPSSKFAKFWWTSSPYGPGGPYWFSPNSQMLESPESGVAWNIISSDQMTDEVSSTGGHPYNPCNHTRIRAAHLNEFMWGGTISQYPGPLTYFVQSTGSNWVSPSSTTAAMAAIESAVASVDWINPVMTLGNLVKGLIDGKSLIAVTLKELPQTIQMVRNPFGLLKADWRKIAGRASARTLAKKGANLWLEYQYGWKSSYIDLKNFAVDSGKYMVSVQRYQDQALRRYSKSSVSLCSALSPTVSDGQWADWRSVFTTTSFGWKSPVCRIVFGPTQVKANVGCWASDHLCDQVTRLYRFLYAYGATGDQLLTTLWEMLPYSFVVDWFVNMNRVINLPMYEQSVKTLSSAQVQRLGFSTKVEIPYSVQIMLNTMSNYWTGTYNAFPWWAVYGQGPSPNQTSVSGVISNYRRTTGLPTAGVSIFAGKGLSASQFASGFSLLLQRILRR